MQLTAAEALASIAVMSAVTFLTRALPFLPVSYTHLFLKGALFYKFLLFGESCLCFVQFVGCFF